VVVAWLLSVEVFYDTEPSGWSLFGVALTVAATAFYFLSPRDPDFKGAPVRPMSASNEY
jgi:hypothetical protein